jgi:hypothetical protein
MRLAITAAISGAALLLTAVPAAHAGVLVQSANGCSSPAAENPFTRWGDGASYVLMQNGAFENGTGGWSLGGASVQSGNESFYVRAGGSRDSRSLRVPPGSSVVSPTICVGLARPTLRFFARSSGGLLLLSSMAVSVRVETSLGLVAEVPIGTVLPNSQWNPLPLPMPIVANLLPLIPGDMTPVQFRFTPVGGATWSLDDVYVDPWARG